ncbi:MAG TPA: hypothetical protein VE964_03820 [Myxococcales bacterium]|nr:hypothetical protein [Myxococcales bacterium]
MAAFIIGPRPAVQPPAGSLSSIPQIVHRTEASQDAVPLHMLMKDKAWPLAQAGPLVLKADFKRGLAAALTLRF